MDISALVTMKNAANCEKHCELQNHESVDFRTQPVPSGMFGSVPLLLLPASAVLSLRFSIFSLTSWTPDH